MNSPGFALIIEQGGSPLALIAAQPVSNESPYPSQAKPAAVVLYRHELVRSRPMAPAPWRRRRQASHSGRTQTAPGSWRAAGDHRPAALEPGVDVGREAAWGAVGGARQDRVDCRAEWRVRSLLHVTARGHQRQSGAEADRCRGESVAAGGRFCEVEEAGLSGGAGGARRCGYRIAASANGDIHRGRGASGVEE
jgi:hypothetical protein